MDWSTYKIWLNDSLKSEIPTHIPAPQFKQLITDSREIKKGDWFIPLKGETFDGHDFIQMALDKGAAGYFINQNYQFSGMGTQIRVDDTMKAYHRIASGWRASLPSKFQLVSLTGSVGKTTVKTMTSLMLSHFAKTFFTPGNQNTDFSIPKALLDIDSSYDYAVLEFGARHPGDIGRLTDIAQPNVSVCLNVGSSHLEIFKTRENILKTKLEIISHSPSQSIGVVLHDNLEILTRARTMGRKLISFGYHTDATVSVRKETQTDSGMSIIYNIGGENYELQLSSYQETHAINAAATLAVGLALQLPIPKCIEALRQFEGVKGRYQVLKTKSGLTVIDDSYNAAPESMKAGLKSVLKSFPGKHPVLILGDMREMGSFAEEAHKGLGIYCTSLNPKYLLTVGRDSKLIAESAIQQGLTENICFHFSNVDELLKKIDFFLKDSELIYVKGSFAIQLNKVVETLTNK